MVLPGARMLEHRSVAASRNGQVRLERGQRRQHERALDDSRMRYPQPLRCDLLPTVEQEVEIDRPRRPAAAVLAAELALDLLQAVRDAWSLRPPCGSERRDSGTVDSNRPVRRRAASPATRRRATRARDRRHAPRAHAELGVR